MGSQEGLVAFLFPAVPLGFLRAMSGAIALREGGMGFGQIAVKGGLDVLEQNISSAYEFLTERGLGFVASFDQSG